MTHVPGSEAEVTAVDCEIARVRVGLRVERLHAVADGRLLARAPDGTTLLVDSATGTVLWRERTECLAMSADAATFAAALYGTGGAHTVWIDAASGEERARTTAMASVLTLAFSDGARIAWTAFAPPVDYGEVVVWDPRANTHTTHHETERLGTPVFLDETCLAAARHGDLWLFEFDVPARRLRFGVSSADLWRMPSGHVLIAEASGRVVQLDVSSGETLCHWAAEDRGSLAVRYDAQGARLLRRPRFPGAESFVEWKMLGGAVQRVMSPSGDGPFLEAAWVPGEVQLAACTARAVYRVCASSGRLAQIFRTHAADLVALAVGNDGTLAWATSDGELHQYAPAR